MTSPRVYAWAHALRDDEAVNLASRITGLGLVLNVGNFTAARELRVAPIMYVTTVAAARTVSNLIRDEDAAPFGVAAVLVDDERNRDGPSGKRLEPDVYAKRFAAIQEEIPSGVPVFTMGLQAIGGPLRTLCRARRFDDQYHRRLPPASGRAFNPNKVRLAEVKRAMSLSPNHQWILSPAPFRGTLDQLLSPISVKGWVALATQRRVTAVALWCLKEHVAGGAWQSEHGLFDRAGAITSVGLQVQRALEASRRAGLT